MSKHWVDGKDNIGRATDDDDDVQGHKRVSQDDAPGHRPDTAPGHRPDTAPGHRPSAQGSDE